MQCRIGFSIAARSGNQGQVVPILETGSGQPHYIGGVQKYVVLDIGGYCARIAQNNIHDVVSLITYIQINCYV